MVTSGEVTFVDEFETRDDVETDFGIIVFEHLKEHWEEMFNSRVFAEDGCETTEIFSKCSSNLRIWISHKLLDRGENLSQNNVNRNQFTES
jgi:hypothetical protein